MEDISIKDETLIREVFNRSVTAWNTGNIELFATLYTDEVDYITFMGEHIKGLAANIDLHRKLWNNYFMKGAMMEGQIMSIKFSGNDRAVMIAEGAIKFRFQKKTPLNRKSINTTVLIKQSNEWKISSFQNTRVSNHGFFSKFMRWMAKKLNK